MLQNGLDRNTVMKLTGLTEDDLAQIRINPLFLALPAWLLANTGGGGRHRTQALPANHSD